MANEINEPRALTTALAGPAFATRGGGLAMHVANRHVERWAPESESGRQRPLRSLGFVDRLIAPWIETAQRSASLRLFSQYRSEGIGERAPNNVSWVFPRPWYQDELDWMTAARQAPQMTGSAAPSLFTTRGTYVPPAAAQQAPAALPSALYEYVAPSLSVASTTQQPAGVGYGGSDAPSQLYSSLVPFAAVQAAETMARAVSPALVAPTARMTPALRNMLSAMLERAATTRTAEPTRLSMQMPELVTPPAPRPADVALSVEPSYESPSQIAAGQLAERYAEQRTRIAEVQRIARQSAERELVARTEAARPEAARTEAARVDATVSPEVREVAQRAEAELRHRAAVTRGEQARTQSEQASQREVEHVRQSEIATTAERARVEERIAQRVAERTAAQRLHEGARAEAAAHARTSIEARGEASSTAATMPVERRAPAEVSAAIAALPPEFAAFIGQRPERAMQAIAELNEALRTVELLARGAASGVTAEPTRGPRLMMPAGLGGLVAAVDRAQVIAEQPGALTGARAMTRLAQPDAAAPSRTMPLPMMTGGAPIATRVPTMSWMSAPTSRVAPTGALDATASASPAALSHVAWADRWLARFAGASKQSLDTLAATVGPTRLQALADAAPGSVFVAPTFDIERAGEHVRVDTNGHVVVTSASAANTAASTASTPISSTPASTGDGVMRFADDAETPDDVFAAISAAASRGRVAFGASAQTATPTVAAFERYTQADAVAHAAPSAPGAGFAAQLASSPFAAALRHVLPMSAAVSFDVRSLFGGGISATYLAGLLDSDAHEVSVGARLEPSWATWSPPLATTIEGTSTDSAATREVPTWDPTYVASDTLAADAGIRDADDASMAPAAMKLQASYAPLTTLRTALLSWDVETGAAASVEAMPTIATSTSSPISTATARSMIEAMSLPMLGDASLAGEPSGAAWTSPGMIADRAHSWSVAQERSTTDLALDFVSPELVLAARVYGLGPAEAAQASRLALAGPGQLTAMAGTVDRTFVQAMAIESDRRERVATLRETLGTAYPTQTGEIIATTRATGAMPSTPAESSDAYAMAAPYQTGTAFGVDRKMPRGAYLWPAATIAALGLNAAAPDGQQSMSVAALELLAAQAVAELGTYAALAEPTLAGDLSGMTSTGSSFESSFESSMANAGSAQRIRGGDRSIIGEQLGTESGESDVLGAAATLVPSARRARFDALYVALSQSPSGRSWSPAARAARALALAGRGEDGPLTARERAATAWDVLPVVYADGGPDHEPVTASAGTLETSSYARGGGVMPFTSARRRGSSNDVADSMISVDNRPGLGALSARAGEALDTYVTPTASSSSSSSTSSSNRESGAVMRAPTAAQELVQTGRPSGRYGGGEVEIPSWFESAARKMLEDRAGASDGISLAELTLVTAAPSSHVAASTRSAPAAAAPIAAASSSAANQAGAAPQIDIEKVANEIYRHILVLMDVARARNGEPYL